VTGGPLLRVADPGDAAALLELKQRLDQETAFMLLEPGERDTSVEALADELKATSQSGNSVVIAAEADGVLVGYVELTGGSFGRNKKTAYLVIGVLAEAGAHSAWSSTAGSSTSSTWPSSLTLPPEFPPHPSRTTLSSP
jgi:hypothetical protein